MPNRDKKEAKFLRLTQKNMSLVEYKRKFDELAYYTPHLVDIEEHKTWRFKKGLRPEFYNTIAMLGLSTYTDVFQWMQLIVKDSIL